MSESLLSQLVGSELAAVEFVRSYIVLVFQPSAGTGDPGVLRPPLTGRFGRLTAYTLPGLQDSGRQIHSGEPGYCDMLVEQIGRRLTQASESGDRLRLEFDGGVITTISLADDDLVGGPESAMLRLDDCQESLMVWRPGDLHPAT